MLNLSFILSCFFFIYANVCVLSSTKVLEKLKTAASTSGSLQRLWHYQLAADWSLSTHHRPQRWDTNPCNQNTHFPMRYQRNSCKEKTEVKKKKIKDRKRRGEKSLAFVLLTKLGDLTVRNKQTDQNISKGNYDWVKRNKKDRKKNERRVTSQLTVRPMTDNIRVGHAIQETELVATKWFLLMKSRHSTQFK